MRDTVGVCGLLMATVVCESAAAWRLHKTYKTYKMMMGASWYTSWVCSVAGRFGSGDELPLGTARQLDGGGGMRKRGGVTLA